MLGCPHSEPDEKPEFDRETGRGLSRAIMLTRPDLWVQFYGSAVSFRPGAREPVGGALAAAAEGKAGLMLGAIPVQDGGHIVTKVFHGLRIQIAFTHGPQAHDLRLQEPG